MTVAQYFSDSASLMNILCTHYLFFLDTGFEQLYLIVWAGDCGYCLIGVI